MSTPEDPFDQTVWEPHGEHAVEDPLHGPSAVHAMLAVPSMPLGDGRYYQSGGFYAVGTPYFDALGAPLYQVGGVRPASAIIRESLQVDEWVTTAQEGEEALTALEARRQQERLEKNGVAHAFKPSDVCGGGKRLDSCDTASAMITDAHAYAERVTEEQPGTGRGWTVPAWLGRTCTECALSCEVTLQTKDGIPTGITRFSNTRPLAGDVVTIRLDSYDT